MADIMPYGIDFTHEKLFNIRNSGLDISFFNEFVNLLSKFLNMTLINSQALHTIKYGYLILAVALLYIVQSLLCCFYFKI